MTLPDTNVWLALALSKHVFHDAAQRWFAAESRTGGVAFCRSTQQSFLRLLTTDAAIRPYGVPPMTNAAAWELYDEFLADPRVSWVAEPGRGAGGGNDRLAARWKSFAARGSASPKLWMDAYLAALAVTGEHRLITTDRAFTQFRGLDVVLLDSPRLDRAS